jgi:hypothetical protein
LAVEAPPTAARRAAFVEEYAEAATLAPVEVRHAGVPHAPEVGRELRGRAEELRCDENLASHAMTLREGGEAPLHECIVDLEVHEACHAPSFADLEQGVLVVRFGSAFVVRLQRAVLDLAPVRD